MPVYTILRKRNDPKYHKPGGGSCSETTQKRPQLILARFENNKQIAPSSSVSLSSRSSTQACLEYRKKLNTQLATLNDNMSNIIKESFSGIDDICNRVRMCLQDMDTRQRQFNLDCDKLKNNHTIKEESQSSEEYEIEEVQQDTASHHTLQARPSDNRDDGIGSDSSSSSSSSATPSSNTIVDLSIEEQNDQSVCDAVQSTQSQTDNVREEISKQMLTLFSNNFPTAPPQVLENIQRTVSMDDTTLSEMIDNIGKSIENLLVDSDVGGDRHDDETEEEEIHVEQEAKDSSNVEITQPEDETIKDVTSHQANEQLDPNTVDTTEKIDQKSGNTKHLDIEGGDSAHQLLFKNLDVKNALWHFNAEVTRKKGSPDIHERLQKQVEYNDSFIGFQKLMNRCRKEKKKMTSSLKSTTETKATKPRKLTKLEKQSKVQDLVKKYEDSLWFSSSKTSSNKLNKSSRHGNKQHKKRERVKNLEKTLAKNMTRIVKLNISGSSRQVSSQKSLRGNSRRGSQKSMVSNKASNSKVTVYKGSCHSNASVRNDIPAWVRCKCKLQWMKARQHQMNKARVLDFCDILDDLTARDLQPIKSEYPRKDMLPKPVQQQSYLAKLMQDGDKAANVLEQLICPSITCNKNDCKCNNSNNNNAMNKIKELGEQKVDSFEKPNSNHSDAEKRKIHQKLLPYLTDPVPELYTQQTLTVMPVHVQYDYNNRRTNNLASSSTRNLNAPKIHLPLSPNKDVVSNAPGHQKGKQPTPGTPKRAGTSNIGLKQTLETTSRASKFSSNQSLPSSCRGAKTLKTPKQQPVSMTCVNYNSSRQPAMPYYKELEQISIMCQQQTAKKMTPQERKLWNNKYGKTTAHKLTSFIENQPPQVAAFAPKSSMPLAPQPKKKNWNPSTTTVKKTSKILSRSTSNLDKPNPVVPTNATNFQNLKSKNEEIQSNIQKAISVIETKMVDIISAPTNSSSAEAFDAMEKEITQVLKLMKTKKLKKRKQKTREGTKPEDLSAVSDQLYDKLQSLLEYNNTVSNSSLSQHNFNQIQEEPVKFSLEVTTDIGDQPHKNEQKEEAKQFSPFGDSIIPVKMILEEPPTDCALIEKETLKRQKMIKDLEQQFKQTEEIYSELDRVNTLAFIQEIRAEHRKQMEQLQIEDDKKLQMQKEQEQQKKLLESIEQQHREEERFKLLQTMEEQTRQRKEEEQRLESIAKFKQEQLRQQREDEQFRLLQTMEYHQQKDDKRMIKIAKFKEERQHHEEEHWHLLQTLEQQQGHLIEQEQGIEDTAKFEQPTSTSQAPCESQPNKQTFDVTRDELSPQISFPSPKQEDVASVDGDSCEERQENEVDVGSMETQKLDKTVELRAKDCFAGEDPFSFSEQVNRVLQKVETIYNKLENEENLTHDSEEESEHITSQKFLTPFMSALKQNKRKATAEILDDQRPARKASYLTVINFLDTLSNINEDNLAKQVEVPEAVAARPNVVSYAFVEQPTICEIKRFKDEGPPEFLTDYLRSYTPKKNPNEHYETGQNEFSDGTNHEVSCETDFSERNSQDSMKTRNESETKEMEEEEKIVPPAFEQCGSLDDTHDGRDGQKEEERSLPSEKKGFADFGEQYAEPNIEKVDPTQEEQVKETAKHEQTQKPPETREMAIETVRKMEKMSATENFPPPNLDSYLTSRIPRWGKMLLHQYPIQTLERLLDEKIYKMGRKIKQRLNPKRGSLEVSMDTKNAFLLKSLYALMYLFMFSALTMDYDCV